MSALPVDRMDGRGRQLILRPDFHRLPLTPYVQLKKAQTEPSVVSCLTGPDLEPAKAQGEWENQ